MIPALAAIVAALCGWIQWGDNIHAPAFTTDATKKEAQYNNHVAKQEEKKKYEKKVLEINPTGYMTVEDYEAKSAAKDKVSEKVGVPRIDLPSNMEYVPQPDYKIVRYNNPPGSPEISLSTTFYKNRQLNAQGIVSPDYSMMVYPAVYYYPLSASVSCDLFVIPLDQNETNLNKIRTANIINKDPNAILSTDKSQDNAYTFRTLTPIDFSPDSKRLLVKEKVGNNKDGIWQTTPIVYDFETRTSYRLIEVRDAIIYHWKENTGLDLDDKRWDVYPLGFDMSNPDRIIVNAYAYTGKNPINLGVWSVDTKGERSKLVSLQLADVPVSVNGLKLEKDGVIPPTIVEAEQKQLERIDKYNAKQKEKEYKGKVKELKQEYKDTIKDMDANLNRDMKYYDARQKIMGSTEGNDVEQKYIEVKEKIDAQLQKQQEQQELREQKLNDKKEKVEEKKLQLKEKLQLKTQEELDRELEQIRSLPLPTPIKVDESLFLEQ